MSVCRFGKTIIDALALCYVAGDELLNSLRAVDYKIDFDKFNLYRTMGRSHSEHFDIWLDGVKVATTYFDRYGAGKKENYLWLRIENAVLYNKPLLVEVLSLVELLDLQFNNVTYLELAKDFKYNISNKIRAMMRNPELTTIINDKQIKDRNKILNNVTRTCGVSLNRDGGKSLTIKQAKAVKNKYDGITLDSYDKVREIESHSHKHYILNYYGNPKRLHRLELRLNNPDIKAIAKRLRMVITEDIIFDSNKLDAIYLEAMHSLLRFTYKRKELDWQMLFNCNLRYR